MELPYGQRRVLPGESRKVNRGSYHLVGVVYFPGNHGRCPGGVTIWSEKSQKRYTGVGLLFSRRSVPPEKSWEVHLGVTMWSKE